MSWDRLASMALAGSAQKQHVRDALRDVPTYSRSAFRAELVGGLAKSEALRAVDSTTRVHLARTIVALVEGSDDAEVNRVWNALPKAIISPQFVDVVLRAGQVHGLVALVGAERAPSSDEDWCREEVRKWIDGCRPKQPLVQQQCHHPYTPKQPREEKKARRGVKREDSTSAR